MAPGAAPLEREPPPLELELLPRRARARVAVLGGIAAGLVGFGLNQLELMLVPAVQLIFGPLAVLAAALLLGPVGGGVAGALAGLATLLRWGHPWAWLGMVLEGVAVGLLARRVRPLRAVLLYWLVGGPYVLAAYVWGLQVPLSDAAVVATKQCLNSLLAVLLVYVVLLVPAVRGRLRAWLPAPLRSVRLADTIAAALLLGTALPLVTAGAVEGRARYTAERERLDAQNRDAARRVADTLDRSLASGLRSATILAAVLSDEAAREGRLPSPERLRQLLGRWLDNSPSLTASYVGDARGAALAYYPAEAARELAQYADRDYFRALQRERRPLLSGVFAGRVVPGAKVAAVAPVWQGQQLVGYVALAVDVGALGALADARIGSTQRARLLDPRGLVVADSQAGAQRGGALTPLSALPLGAALAARADAAYASGEYVAGEDPVTLRQARASYAWAVAPLTQPGWRVVVEQPLGFVDSAALQSYAALLGSLGLAFVVVVLGSRALSRVVARPLEAVSDAVQRFARGERTARAGSAGAQGTAEVERLSRDFDALADQLHAQLEALERARGERDQFLSVASHELKTPLATLKAQVQLLQRRLPEPEAATVPRLLRQLDRITRLVNLMLDVSELESGRLQLERRPIALDAVVRDAAVLRAASSPLHLLRLKLSPVQLTGDAPRLEQLVHNLVDNAVKFSPEGGPVEVTLAQEGHEAVLRVADRGVGLSAADEALLLRRFPGGQQPSVARVAGLGVGLFFCREVAERHGGSIHLQPQAGGGAVATVRLPCAAPSPPGSGSG